MTAQTKLELQNFASHKTGGLNLAILDYNKFCFLEHLEDLRAPPRWMAQRKCALFWSIKFDVPHIQDNSDLGEITVLCLPMILISINCRG